MAIAGKLSNLLQGRVTAYLDTIGEGAGVYLRLIELGFGKKVYSCKGSENAQGLLDITGEREFANMRAYMLWAVRDWLDPSNGEEVCLPPIPELIEELSDIRFKIQSNGKIIIEPKEDIKERLGRSPDYADALAYTFYPGALKPTGAMSIFNLSGMLP